jgi:predicted XRE-type DNA-binding protein
MRATRGSENVLVDCGFPPAEAENLRMRAQMMIALTGYLVRGKIGQFTIDTLVNMVTAAGLKVDLDITAGRPKAKSKQVA